MINERKKKKITYTGRDNDTPPPTPQSRHQSSGQSIVGENKIKKIEKKSIDLLAGPLDTVQP